jgi:hypothetical protein
MVAGNGCEAVYLSAGKIYMRIGISIITDAYDHSITLQVSAARG